MPQHGNLLNLERCPHCSVDQPHLSHASTIQTADYAGANQRRWSMYKCNRCGGVVTAWSHENSTEIQDMYPSPLTVEETIPDRAKEYLEQAISSINAPAGAVMLAASSVDAMLKDKGLTDGNLYSRINTAVQENLITESMSQWAHEVRLDANDQRHADNESSLPTTADARKLIDFVQALGAFLYVLPSRVERGIANAQGS